MRLRTGPAVNWDNPYFVAGFVGAIAALLGSIWWLWWQLPKRQVRGLDIQIHDPKARADAEDNFRKTVGQALGGAAMLIGAGAAYLQFWQQQQTSQNQLQASRDLLISNQVSKGFEQLGSDKSAVRVGGAYALEGVMDTSPQYRQPVLEALCAFMRDQTISTTISNVGPTIDIQAALTVIGRRPNGSGRINLSGANIPNADLFGAQLLQSAILRGVNLNGALLRMSLLHGADLMGASLSGADLRVADLTGASLVRADLRGARLDGATLIQAYLNGADLAGARLDGQQQLDAACGMHVILPDGTIRDLKSCPDK